MLAIQDRRWAMGVGAIATISTIASLVMIGSIMPFLSFLADPELLKSNARFAKVYAYFGFEDRYNFLISLGVISVMIVISSNIIQLVSSFVMAKFTHRVAHSVSVRLLYCYLLKEYEFFMTKNTADMSQRVLSEASQFVGNVVSPTLSLVTGAVSISLVFAFLLFISPWITLGAIVFVFLLYSIAFLATRRALKEIAIKVFETNRAKFRTSSEALGGIKEIKALGRETFYVQRYLKPSKIHADKKAESQILRGIPAYVIQTAAMAGIILICLVLVPRSSFENGNYIADVLPILVAFALASQRLLPQVGGIYRSIVMLQASGPILDAIYPELCNFELPPLEVRVSAPLSLRKSVVFERVEYRYPGSQKTNLTDVNIEISKGERIGIVGATGAGKTTLADLLLGLIEPTDGRILIDGVALSGELLPAWKQVVGYVPQSIFLSDSAVRENIALGTSPAKINDAKVVDASRIAQISAFIENEMPMGYRSSVGERGVRLSGGQKQRIGIARALYHNADLIIFDEATSALDGVTEREVMDAIEGLPGDKTILMIAHRLSTVHNCDKIIVLDKGRIVGFAHWDELMATNEFFQRIAKSNEAT